MVSDFIGVARGFAVLQRNPQLSPLRTIRCMTINKDDSMQVKVSSSTNLSRENSIFDGNASDELQKAKELKRKAQELLQEANRAELELRSSKKQELDTKNKYLDKIFDEISAAVKNLNSTSSIDSTFVPILKDSEELEIIMAVVDVLRRKPLTSSTMLNLIDRIYERETMANEKVLSTLTTNANAEDFVIGDVTNSVEYNQAELSKLEGWIDRLIQAQSILDKDTNENRYTDDKRGLAPALEARIRQLRRKEEEDYQRKLAHKINKGSTANEKLDGMPQLVSQTLGLDGDKNVTIKIDGKEVSGSQIDISQLMKDLVRIPMWVPSSILPFVVTCRTELDLDDLKKIKTDVLPSDQVRVTSWDSMKFGAIYRLNLMTKRQSSVLSALSGQALASSKNSDGVNAESKDEELRNMKNIFQGMNERLSKAGLSDRIQLFLLEDPEWRPGQTREPEPLPVILAVSSGVVPEQGNERGNAKKFVTMFSILSTIFTTFAYGVASYALNPTFFDAVVNKSDISVLAQSVPIMIGVFGVNVIHELSHYFAAKVTNTVIGLPVPLPSLQIGSFGAITPFRSFPKNREAMFDVAMSGPIASFMSSIAFMIVGIFLTIHSSAEQISSLATVPAALMKTSLLVGSLTSVLAPKIMMIPLSQPIAIHPLFLVGFAGTVFSALNLLPIGRLDGGRACSAVFGRRNAVLLSFSTLLFLSIAAITGSSTISIFWGLLVTVFQRNLDVPVRDDWSEVNNTRVTIFFVAMLFTIITLVPFPGGEIL